MDQWQNGLGKTSPCKEDNADWTLRWIHLTIRLTANPTDQPHWPTQLTDGGLKNLASIGPTDDLSGCMLSRSLPNRCRKRLPWLQRRQYSVRIVRSLAVLGLICSSECTSVSFTLLIWFSVLFSPYLWVCGRWSASLSVYLSVCLPAIWLSVSLSTSFCGSISGCLSVYMHVCLSALLFFISFLLHIVCWYRSGCLSVC